MESNVLCAFDASFGAGLLDALTQVTVDCAAVLLVAYDTEYPAPIDVWRPVPDAFGVAMVLTPERGAGSLARIVASLQQELPDTLTHPVLESFRTSIPAARCLPLLRLLSLGVSGRALIDYLEMARIAVEVEPCV